MVHGRGFTLDSMVGHNDYAWRLAEAMRASGATTQALADALGISYQAVKKALDGKSKSLTAVNNTLAAQFMGVNPDWLATGKGARNITNPMDGALHPGGASQKGVTMRYKPLPLIHWADLSTMNLTGTFRSAAPDDAMSPRVKSGQMLVFDASLDPKPGDGVLVSDAAGAHYFRRYQEGRPGYWQAVALNDAYQTLASDRDGLRLVAVLVAVEARWS